MNKIGDMSFRPLQFDKKGGLAQPEQEQAVMDMVAREKPTDLFVASHGWRNDAGTALNLYKALFTRVDGIVRRRGGGERKAALVGIFWPSKPRYADYGSLTRPAAAASGGAASAGSPVPADEAAAVRQKLEEFKSLFEDDPDREAIFAQIDEAAEEAERLDQPAAQNRFVDKLRAVVFDDPTAPEEDRTDRLVDPATLGSEIISDLEQPTWQVPARSPDSGGAAALPDFNAPPAFGTGGAAGLIGSARSAGIKLVEMLSYYEMKERAGRVGQALQPLLARLAAAHPGMRIHLVGHSFGARLVTSAVSGNAGFRAASMTLLQAAFSHNAFSGNYNDKGHAGFFRSVVEGRAVNGPIVITHTANDSAVGVAYPLASRLARQQANSVGGRDDLFGALGRNGAVKTGEARPGVMKNPDDIYAFEVGDARIFNLLADDYIRDRDGQDAHGDVTNSAVANVVAGAAGF